MYFHISPKPWGVKWEEFRVELKVSCSILLALRLM